jgi:hypothetical protein
MYNTFVAWSILECVTGAMFLVGAKRNYKDKDK